ncbi:signal-transducing histidine kinase-like protein [Haloferax volcanii DS2]|uniref:histidine kinase n=1 Tax=Haloferax volcanii (strain ATCC 29605 / DSM 3757 / JCM 8879 / NBRC 14742 / NCIMB 2012 / VKM B-1768 / DS2) TaxID=309800 RepID=L9UMS1_HALVD|nr:signal-transducing histidine kinase-like protein [Haloferax volcanii DS2]
MALFVVVSNSVASVASDLAGLVAAAFGLIISVLFVAVGPVVYRSDLKTSHVARVAGWNLLGVAVTVFVLALIGSYQQAAGGTVSEPLFSAAVVVGVSAVAHVLIGLNDVRRIRTRELSEQYKRSAVINRLVRHNLRHTAQLLLGWGDRLATDGGDDETVRIGQRLKATGDDLGTMSDQVKTVTQLVDNDHGGETVDLRELLDPLVDDRSAANPEATITVRGDGSAAVVGGKKLQIAFREIVDNALEHAGSAPTVEIAYERVGSEVVVRIADDGPGIPDHQRELIEQNVEESDLAHGNGLGLWLSKWIVEAYGGELHLPPTDDGEGAVVEFHLDAA